MKIRDLGEGFQLVTDSQTVSGICEDLGITDRKGGDSLFIRFGSHGDVEEVYSFEGIVPGLDKTVERIY